MHRSGGKTAWRAFLWRNPGAVLQKVGDIRRVYRLLDECLEVGADPDGWRHRLAGGVRKIFRCGIVITGEFENIYDDAVARALHITDIGWESREQQSHFVRYQLEAGNRNDPLRSALVSRKAPLVVASLASVVDFDVYRQSEVFRAYMAPARTGDQLVAIAEIAGSAGKRWNMVTAIRGIDEALFDRGDRQLMRRLAGELAALVGSRLSNSTSPVMRLTPREHQALRLLLEGGSEAAVAREMNIAPSTLHRYVMDLYRAFAVNSRAALQARFAGRGRLSTERERTADPRHHRARREGTPMTRPWRAPGTIRRSI